MYISIGCIITASIIIFVLILLVAYLHYKLNVLYETVDNNAYVLQETLLLLNDLFPNKVKERIDLEEENE